MHKRHFLFCLLTILFLICCAGAGNSGSNSSNNTNNNQSNNNNCTICTLDHQRCIDGKLQTCIEHTPCPTWANTEICSETDKICVENMENHTASCVIPCTAECAVGESTCRGDVLYECQEIEQCPIFVSETDCAATGKVCIYAGETQTASCVEQCVSNCSTENATRCQNNQVETCTASGNCFNWVLSSDCSTEGKTCQMVGSDAVCMNSTTTLNLFLSEYLEGSGNNKALEIFVMSAPSGFNLSSCVIQIFYNGSSSVSRSITLSSAALTAGSTFVICHTLWDLSYTCDQKATLDFNGNDALKLVCSGIVQDVFGKVGEDPGAAWTGGGVTTIDVTLRRKCATIAGDTNDSDAFDPSVQWTQASRDDITNLGSFLPCKK